MKIVFFGTPDFACRCLEDLLNHQIEIAAVVTRADQPQGRHLHLAPSPVKAFLLEHKKSLPLFQPKKASDPLFLEELRSLQADLFVVVAYGQILSRSLLAIPPLGCINVHTSLLPKYRGAAPIQRALLQGEKETGVSIQKMVYELDAGDVVATAKIEIPLEMTFFELEKTLLSLAKPLLRQVLKSYEMGVPQATVQDECQVSYAPKVLPEEGEIHWDRSAMEIHNLVRAFSPRPGAWCKVLLNREIKRLKIFRSFPLEREGRVGEILSLDGVVGCKEGALQLLEVQLEGKKRCAAADWLRGQRNISFVL